MYQSSTDHASSSMHFVSLRTYFVWKLCFKVNESSVWLLCCRNVSCSPKCRCHRHDYSVVGKVEHRVFIIDQSFRNCNCVVNVQRLLIGWRAAVLSEIGTHFTEIFKAIASVTKRKLWNLSKWDSRKNVDIWLILLFFHPNKDYDNH